MHRALALLMSTARHSIQGQESFFPSCMPIASRVSGALHGYRFACLGALSGCHATYCSWRGILRKCLSRAHIATPRTFMVSTPPTQLSPKASTSLQSPSACVPNSFHQKSTHKSKAAFAGTIIASWTSAHRYRVHAALFTAGDPIAHSLALGCAASRMGCSFMASDMAPAILSFRIRKAWGR